MKLPLASPNLIGLMENFLKSSTQYDFFNRILQKKIGPVTSKGEYIHWDKLRHLQPPEALSSEEWWLAIKFARDALYKSLPFTDKANKHMQLTTPDEVLQKLHSIDRMTGNPAPVLSSDMKDSHLISSLIEEAITSSQLEGASTTRKVAKEMLQTSRKPRTKSEQMILNNYEAMKFVQDIKKEKITVKAILELHLILTKETLDDPATAGQFRKSEDDVNVWDNSDGTLLHTPPAAAELKKRLQKLCDFANAETNDFFIHPVIKAILMHFVLAYDHPFVDGNGRTARALFYWSMAHQGYGLMEFVSISKILKESSKGYARAFLLTETDENDVTYFIIHQLDVILKAISALYNYIDKKTQELKSVEKTLQLNQKLYKKLNYRQIALIRHALKHHHYLYKIEVHREFHNITYQTARTDLLKLEKLKLLTRISIGKAFTFEAAENLQKKIQGL